MKILVLTKRQYMRRDLITDRFGRFWELPRGLAARGHAVLGLALSYRHEQETTVLDDAGYDRAVEWQSLNAGRVKVPGLARFVGRAREIAKTWRPDAVLACSDTIYAVVGEAVARGAGAAFVIDLYDNFETYASARLPLMLPLFRRAVRAADGVICISEPLHRKVEDEYRRTGPSIVIENGISTDVFKPRDKASCRAELRLPEHAPLVGTAGALTRDRGIELLYEAFDHAARSVENLHLVVAGPRDIPVPRRPGIVDLGVLPPAAVPTVLGALDLAVICNKPSSFGEYCFPQKFYEILGCRIPVCAAEVGSLKLLLRGYADCLFDPGDPRDLAQKIVRQIAKPTMPDLRVQDWPGLAARLSAFLVDLVAAQRRPQR
jgi:glycosyltransferase involved in cell wall biosynthesis